MTATEKANDMVDRYRMILMDEDTDCGNECLCTLIAKRFALATVHEVLSTDLNQRDKIWWQEVKYKIQEL